MLSLLLRLFSIAIVFALSVATARLLGPRGYGAVAWVISVAQLMAVLSTFGFAALAVKEIPSRLLKSDYSELSSHLTTGFRITLWLSITGAIGFFLILSQRNNTNLTVGALLTIPLAFLYLFRGWAQGFKSVPLAQIPGEICRPLLVITSIALLYFTGVSVSEHSFLTASLFSYSLAALIAFATIKFKVIDPLPKSEPKFKPDFHQSLPLLGLAFAAVLQGEINTLMLGWLAGSEETGLFQPVARIAPLMLLAVEATSMAYAPRVAELWRGGDRDRIQNLTTKFSRTTAGLTILFGLAVLVMSKQLMAVFGREFVTVSGIIWVVVAAQVLNACCGPVGALLTMTGHSKLALAGQCAGLITNAGLAYFLVPTHGAIGACLSMAGGIIVWNLAMLAAVSAKLQVDPTIFGISQKSRSAV
ncbi:oligosaccharide flippase family protein [Croceicoccus bisphenolivorans]|uniref:oligosaccharide flippase family protein n=1 Tax=Croceicoccus bisphenolivorans TaxID=1783232 RepID=UPI00082B44F0|nr:oligosaccharide flippase family protein [Croceicoccus bisphenolivorans]